MRTRPTAGQWIWQWLRSRKTPPGISSRVCYLLAARLGDRKRAEGEIAQALQLSPGETTDLRSTWPARPGPSRFLTQPLQTCCGNSIVSPTWRTLAVILALDN
jgi:hypothetical protein